MSEIELRASRPADAGFPYELLKATMREYVAQIWGWDERWQQAYFRSALDLAESKSLFWEART